MRIIALGTSDFVKHCICGFVDAGHSVVLLVSLHKEFQPDNSSDLREFAILKGIDYQEVLDINSAESVSLLIYYSPDLIFSAWPRMLRRPVLEIPRFGTIGSHPTPLPLSRGRHPLHWQMVLGINESALSFFRMDEGVDSGNILLQVPYSILAEDTISDLNIRVNQVGYSGAKQLGQILASEGIPVGIRQNDDKATYWRKRTRHDVLLDFRMSANSIIKTVNSFTLPYSCAMFIFQRELIHVVEANICSGVYATEDVRPTEPGKVYLAKDKFLRVKTTDAVVDLVCLEKCPDELVSGSYILPPSTYLCSYANELIPKLHL